MVRITKYLILIDLKHNDEFLLIHGLFGYISVITKTLFMILNDWIANGVKTPKSKPERQLYDYFMDRHFFLSEEEESSYKENLVNRLVDRHTKITQSPHTATFIPSYRCNFACPYCFEKNVKRNSPVLTESQVDAALKLYPKGELHHVAFYGGEPFLPEHKNIIAYIIEHTPEVEYSAVTNGYYLNDFIPFFAGKKIKNIQVTFDGPEDIHNNTRMLNNGKGTFKHILNGVEHAIKKNIPIKIRMNLSENNIKECYQFKEWLTSFLGNSTLLSFDMQELFQYGTQTKAELSEIMVNQSNVGKPNIIFDNNPPLAQFFYNNKPLRPVISGCSSGIINRIYDPYGDIYTCYLGVGNNKKSIGTYWPQEQYKNSNMLTRTADKIATCNDCKFMFLCGGGCANPIIDAYGDVMLSNCSAMNHMLYYLIPQLYKKQKELDNNEAVSDN